MIEILTWASIIAGGLLIVLLLLSLIGGLDVEVDIGDTDLETDAGGLGVVKGLLTFVSVGSWVMKILLLSKQNLGLALCIGALVGTLAILLLNYLIRLLLQNQSNVNWSMEDALFAQGEVYLRIPAEEGSGIVQVIINGARRELKAKSQQLNMIPTGAKVTVVDIDGEYVKVEITK